jgi:hypothetical protein
MGIPVDMQKTMAVTLPVNGSASFRRGPIPSLEEFFRMPLARAVRPDDGNQCSRFSVLLPSSMK